MQLTQPCRFSGWPSLPTGSETMNLGGQFQEKELFMATKTDTGTRTKRVNIIGHTEDLMVRLINREELIDNMHLILPLRQLQITCPQCSQQHRAHCCPLGWLLHREQWCHLHLPLQYSPLTINMVHHLAVSYWTLSGQHAQQSVALVYLYAWVITMQHAVCRWMSGSVWQDHVMQSSHR